MQATYTIAGYKFISIPQQDLPSLRTSFFTQCQTLSLKGTILLSIEGININLSGSNSSILHFKNTLIQDSLFSDIIFKQSVSDFLPFKRLKIKIKKEIITLRQPHIHPETHRAPAILPSQLKQWLDEKRDITLLDTRNDYEIDYGTFTQATHLKLKDFSHFPHATTELPKTKPIVMFCTGGVRCEKAALQLLQNGFVEVYQLEGGILNYFEQIGEAHYTGTCFVFDERVALDSHLQPINHLLENRIGNIP